MFLVLKLYLLRPLFLALLDTIVEQVLQLNFLFQRISAHHNIALMDFSVLEVLSTQKAKVLVQQATFAPHN